MAPLIASLSRARRPGIWAGRPTARRWHRLACPIAGAFLLVHANGVHAAPSASSEADEGAAVGSPALAAPAAVSGQSGALERAVGRNRYLDRLTREAQARGLPPAIADAVASVESGYNPRAVGAAGEVGLMQVMPATAAMLGLKEPATALLDPETNIRFGVAYLARAWTLANGDLCRALMKYRAGPTEERMTVRSVEYCRIARSHLAAIGSSFAYAAIPPLPAATTPTTHQGRSAVQDARQAALAAITARFWAAYVARVRAIEARSARLMRGG
jgi:Transglycosylase SLT domain